MSEAQAYLGWLDELVGLSRGISRLRPDRGRVLLVPGPGFGRRVAGMGQGPALEKMKIHDAQRLPAILPHGKNWLEIAAAKFWVRVSIAAAVTQVFNLACLLPLVLLQQWQSLSRLSASNVSQSQVSLCLQRLCFQSDSDRWRRLSHQQLPSLFSRLKLIR